jgi:phosphatidylinositol-3-phosphatase
MSPRLLALLLALTALFVVPARDTHATVIKHVIVIAMENVDARDIYGNTRQAPYINRKVMPQAARAKNFRDRLGLAEHSEPHYIMMQAGKRKFHDHTFKTNRDPSAQNSTASHQHLVWQLDKSGWPVKPTWMAYQQGIVGETGACPIASAGRYAAKHNPFVFFRDISGSPPRKDNAYCAAHHKPLSALSGDLVAGTMANYVFITPDLCHDMHEKCGAPSRIRAGDRWLENRLPEMISWADLNDAVIFIIWDEGQNTRRLPFFAIGPGVKKAYASGVEIDHRSYVLSLSEIFGVPVLDAVTGANSLAPLFKDGFYP